MDLVAAAIKHVLMHPRAFSAKVLGTPLRPYQAEVLEAIVQDALEGRGTVFTVHMARQMGKNETSAHLEAYLLTLFQRRNARMVKTAPTYKPQTLNSMMRLEQALQNPWTAGRWQKRAGYIFQLGNAQIAFLSGEPGANVVGHTANLLLEVDEAQDFDEEKYSRDFRPMASTGNATTVLYGTAWTSDTLLAKTIEANKELEKKDGHRRHYEYPWDILAELSPQYRQFVLTERDRLGEDHPIFLTQYALRTIDHLARLFTPAQLAAIRTPAAPRVAEGTALGTPIAGLDPAGQALTATSPRPHDRTVLILGTATQAPGGPSVIITHAYAWQGARHADTMPQILQALRAANVQTCAVDATGIGEPYATYLQDHYGPSRIIPVKYSRPLKSSMAFALIAAAATGRLKATLDEPTFWQELELAMRKALPGGYMDFYVPETAGHDDYLNALALALYAAQETGAPPASTTILPQRRKEEL